MPKKWTRWVALFSLTLFCSIAFAQSNLVESNGFPGASTFDVQNANRTLDKLTIQLSIVNVNPQNLEKASSILSRLQKNAQECVNQSQNDIAKLDDQIEETKPGAQTNTPFIQYVQSKKLELQTQKSECKLFVLRSGEALTAFQTTVKKLSAKRLLTVKPDFWSNLITGITEIKQIPKKFNAQLFSEYGGWKTIHTPLALGLLGIFLLAGLIVGIQLNFSLDNYLSQLKIVETFPEKINLALLSTCKRYVTPIILLAILTADITVLGDPSHLESYLLTIVSGTFVYAVLSALIYFFFLPFHGLPPVSGLSESVAHPLLTRLRFLLALCLFGFIFYVLFHDQPFPDSFMNLAHTTFITLLIINLISILWLINRIPKILNHHPSVRIIISSLLTVALITLVAAEWFGYQQLVSYMLQGITLTLLFGFITWLLHRTSIGTLRSVVQDTSVFPEIIRHQLGVKRYERIPELLWLHVVLYIVIWGGFALVLLRVWKLSETHFQALIETLTNGFKITGMYLIPARIFSAFVFFVVSFLLIRWIRNILEHPNKEVRDIGAQQALAAIVAYTSICVVVLISLLIAGVDFAGLAIIAGALSVGIGFGLQNIVNNFLSGIILLLERPVKPGDRVSINGVEGFVKRIRIRYTQIRTLKYSDLIVPNSEMISKQITNLMFQDVSGRVHTSVGVAYGSDTDLVQKLLLSVVNDHPEVIKDDPSKQCSAFFTAFGDNSLKFDVYCVIRNINLKFIVRSELNIAINKIFKQYGISIAFPQRDLHIKEWPGMPK